MKAVLISIQPHWCELIASRDKTVEIRKTRPNLGTPFKVYIYCTADTVKRIVFDEYGDRQIELVPQRVIGEFTCNQILAIDRRGFNNNFDYCYESLNIFGNDDIEPYITAIRKSCIGKKDLNGYAKDNPYLYGWHISELKIYDKPKKIGEFYFPEEKYCEHGLCGGCPKEEPLGEYGDVMFDCEWKRPLSRPPQSWCYVEEV